MSDTATTTKRDQAPRNVDYSLEVIEGDLPESSSVRHSPINDNLKQIEEKTEIHGKWVRIGGYANGSAASAAGNVLRQKRGRDATASGWSFTTKRIDDSLTGLFAKFTPDAIVPGAMESHVAAEKARLAGLAEKKGTRSGKADGGTKGEAAPAPADPSASKGESNPAAKSAPKNT